MKRLDVLILLLSITVFIIAQPVCQVKHFSVNNGLAQGNVMGMLQDQKGFIWFSTWNGLSKYDGYTFKTYKTFRKTVTLSAVTVWEQSPKANTEISGAPTHDGQACLFDVETEKFIDVLQPLEITTKHSNYVSRILSLKKGIAWIICKTDTHIELMNNYANTEKVSHCTPHSPRI